jgi:uncharacterized membrane protein
MDAFHRIMELVGMAVDGAGVVVVVTGLLFASGRFLLRRTAYPAYRRELGRAILLGLEFLIAGDIIRTVVVAPTMQNVAVLGVIVLIRIVLSLSLQMEVDGRLPWQTRTSCGEKTCVSNDAPGNSLAEGCATSGQGAPNGG